MEAGQRRQFIATKGRWTYGRAMVAGLIRLLALIAFVSMPIGMSAAAAPHVPAAGESGAGEHCADHQAPEGDTPVEAPDTQALHCTGCTALPAADQPVVIAALLPTAPPTIAFAESKSGFEPGITTPPPRRS